MLPVASQAVGQIGTERSLGCRGMQLGDAIGHSLEALAGVRSIAETIGR